MVTLLTYAGDVPADAPVLRTGGLPLVPDGFAWPDCSECEGPMMFHAHLPVEAGVVSIFMCQNDPGLCEEWDPRAGGNAAYLFPSGTPLQAVNPPEEGETLLAAVTGLRPTEMASSAYPDALDVWTEAGNDRHDTLGQLGGAPCWLQGDGRPVCPDCARPMGFAAMLDPGGRGYQAGINFGGDGWGYVFTCADCVRASFLWQC